MCHGFGAQCWAGAKASKPTLLGTSACAQGASLLAPEHWGFSWRHRCPKAAFKQHSPVLMSLWWLSVLPGVKSSLPLGPASSREVPEVGYGDESPRAVNPSASTCSPAGTGFWCNSCRGSPCGTRRGVAMTRGAQRGESIPVAVPAAGQDAGDTARGCVRSWWWFGGAEPGWPLGRDFPLCMLEMFSKLPAGPAEPGLSSF